MSRTFPSWRAVGGHTWRRVRAVGGYAFPLVVFLVAWEAVSRLRLLNPVLLPPPSVVAVQMVTLLGAGPSATTSFLLEKNVFASSYRIFFGYAGAAILCTPLGILMGMHRRAHNFFHPIISAFLPIPSLALVPVVILWLGLGDPTVIFIVFFASIFPIIYNTAAGVRSVPSKYLWSAQIMGAGRSAVFFRVLLPAALPYIIAGQKLALGSSWRALVAAEMLAATDFGLGYMIFQARTFLDTESIYAGIIMIAILGTILEKGLFGYLEHVTVERWGMVRSAS